MNSLILEAIPFLTLILQLLTAVALISIWFRKSWGKEITEWLGRHSLLIGFILSLGVVLGSLFYSNIIGFDPCSLCWWQRIALYPLLVLFAVALKDKDRNVFKYVWPFALAALIFSVYQSYITFGGTPLLECGLNENCTKLYVFAYGFITLPMMATTVAVSFLTLYWANRTYQK